MADAINVETRLDWNQKSSFTVSTRTGQALEVAGLDKMNEIPGSWSPLHLFVSSLETCFYATLSFLLDKSRIVLKSYKSRAVGELTSSDGKNKEISTVRLYVEAELKDPKDSERFQKIAGNVEKYCYVARSVKCEIVPEVKLV